VPDGCVLHGLFDLIPNIDKLGTIAHPRPQPLPAGWSGHFQKPEPLTYVQVEPAGLS
jgi:hypothetical protein